MAAPFMLEPEYEVGEEPESDSDEWEEESESEGEGDGVADDQRWRLRSTEGWCHCRICATMESVKMCICCKEIDATQQRRTSENCITSEQNFDTVCLNRDVLWTALVSLHDRESSALPRPGNVPNESLRYAAYRQFTWWIHGFLGKKIRRVIPACVVKKIRVTFPSEDGRYTGFKDSDEEHNRNEVDLAWE